MDKLIEAIARSGNPSVVGLDPTPALIPTQLMPTPGKDQNTAGTQPVHVDDGYDADRARSLADAYLRFNRAVMQGVQGIVPAVKPQIAMYEALGQEGVRAYIRSCALAQEMGFSVIGDIKRGDIGSTASAYASHLSGVPGGRGSSPWHEDAITVNPYLGSDGITPFAQAAEASDTDLFVLVRTSNPSSGEIQELKTEDGRAVYECVADLVSEWGRESIGEHGYSRLGAVVGATHPQAGRSLRARMPHTFFLIPGYGAQGGSAQDVAAMFDDHASGALVNSSRGIIGAWRTSEGYSPDMSVEEACDTVSQCARAAAIAMRDTLLAALDAR
ncbi:orotidine-5'-phosphate decarboxylase [Bifidobacterium psychraerophilum]|uniref:orotidine-5'-phosphate decarboxylase n=1 Tax=Bifidobacterium psychraerophilum TaxID=218140 RepID=UPI0039ED1AA2